MFKKILFSIALLLSASAWSAGSSINTTVPAAGAPLQSAPIRANFQAAANDINAIITQNGSGTPPLSPLVGQLWLNTAATPYVLNSWDGAAWVVIGNLNATTHVWTSPGINGGTVDAACIGCTTPAAGFFTTLSSSGATTFTARPTFNGNTPYDTGNLTIANYLTTASAASTYAPLASPVFTGTPSLPTGTTAVTQTAGNSSAAPATTQFVATSFAPLASPTFSGTPTAPNPAAGNSTGQIATTQFLTIPGPIGSVTASTGAFTTLAASSTVSGTGFSTYLASPPAIGGTTAAAGKFTTLQATSAITPSTTAGIIGTKLADNANAGSVGELATPASAQSVAITNNVSANITSFSLAAGFWMVTGVAGASANATTLLTSTTAGISTTSATLGAFGTYAQLAATSGAGAGSTLFSLPPTIINVSTSTTVYCVVQASFTVSTAVGNCNLQAIRLR